MRKAKKLSFKDAVNERVQLTLAKNKLLAQVQQLQFELEEERQLVYPVAALRREQAAAVYAMKSRLLSAPAKIAARVSGITDMHVIEKEIRETITECLNELSDLSVPGDDELPSAVRQAIQNWVKDCS